MAFTEDFTEYLNTSDFAVTATWAGGGSAVGIFDLAYSEDLNVAGNLPLFATSASSTSSLSVGTSITIAAQSYTVAEKKPDGTGMTILVLQIGATEE